MNRPGNNPTDAIGQIPGRRDRFADDSSIVEWTKREGDLFKVHSASSLNDQSKPEIYKQEDQWSRRPSPVHLDWRNNLQQPDDLGIYHILRPSLILQLHRSSQGRGNLNVHDLQTLADQCSSMFSSWYLIGMSFNLWRSHALNGMALSFLKSVGRRTVFQEGPSMHQVGLDANQAAQHSEELTRKHIASEWNRWQAHEARHDLAKQTSRHAVYSPNSSIDNQSQFKKLLDHSSGSSSVQREQRPRDDEVSHRQPGWPMFGVQDQLTLQVRKP